MGLLKRYPGLSSFKAPTEPRSAMAPLSCCHKGHRRSCKGPSHTEEQEEQLRRLVFGSKHTFSVKHWSAGHHCGQTKLRFIPRRAAQAGACSSMAPIVERERRVSHPPRANRLVGAPDSHQHRLSALLIRGLLQAAVAPERFTHHADGFTLRSRGNNLGNCCSIKPVNNTRNAQQLAISSKKCGSLSYK